MRAGIISFAIMDEKNRNAPVRNIDPLNKWARSGAGTTIFSKRLVNDVIVEQSCGAAKKINPAKLS